MSGEKDCLKLLKRIGKSLFTKLLLQPGMANQP